MASPSNSENSYFLPIQQFDDSINSFDRYYDIMIVGRTGMGKSTTADKLLICHPDKNFYISENSDDDTTFADRRVRMSDLSMWYTCSETDRAVRRMEAHLKNLVSLRTLDKPHLLLNEYYGKRSNNPNAELELISNDTTKLRVLEVPGFGKGYSRFVETSPSRGDGIAIMREVLHIQVAMKMNFRRILYFIPERGSLRDRSLLQLELEQMMYYFGKSIFDCMVLIATVSPEVYAYLPDGVTPFSNNSEMITRDNFQEVLSVLLPPNEVLPANKPPIVFISMNDSGNDIHTKILDASVTTDSITLPFIYYTCVTCGIHVKALRVFNKMYMKESGVSTSEERVACYYGSDPSQCIPYEESVCHPLIKDKRWTITKLLSGHVMSGVCVHCNQFPGTGGCIQVRKQYELSGRRTITIDHSLIMTLMTELSNEGNRMMKCTICYVA